MAFKKWKEFEKWFEENRKEALQLDKILDIKLKCYLCYQLGYLDNINPNLITQRINDEFH